MDRIRRNLARYEHQNSPWRDAVRQINNFRSTQFAERATKATCDAAELARLETELLEWEHEVNALEVTRLQAVLSEIEATHRVQLQAVLQKQKRQPKASLHVQLQEQKLQLEAAHRLQLQE
jgi:hypothetical protein